MFTPYVYTWVSPAKGLVQIGIFIATFLSVCYAIKLTYPDTPAFPREFEGGLEKELGGSGATRVSGVTDKDAHALLTTMITDEHHRQERRTTQSRSRPRWMWTERGLYSYRRYNRSKHTLTHNAPAMNSGSPLRQATHDVFLFNSPQVAIGCPSM